MSKRNSYTKEFKEQVLEVTQNTPKSLASVAKEFGISYPTLIGWKKSSESKSADMTSQKDFELNKPKQENDLLRKENEILKKAATFFAKQLG